MDHARAQEFQASAPARCPHAQECPGCPLIALDYGAQLQRKQHEVRCALAMYPELAGLEVLGVAPAQAILGYRVRAKLVAQRASLGLYARGSHRVVDIHQCVVLDPLVASAVAALRARLGALVLHGVDVARAGERLLMTLIAPHATPREALLQLALALREAVPALAGVALARRDDDAVQLLTTGHELLCGAAELPEGKEGAPYHYVALGAFMQAHADTSAAIYGELTRRVLASANGPPRVLELYAGSGSLSLALAHAGAAVTAVESYAPACERLVRAAREQHLNVRVRQGDAAVQLRALHAAGARFDVVLVNPPRRGLEPELRKLLADTEARQVGYVSCRPSTLARDLSHLARLGLRCAALQPFDMMPLTEQVETLAWLEKGAPARAAALHQERDLLAVSKEAHEPASGPQPGSLARRIPGEHQQGTPWPELDEQASGALLYAHTDPDSAACTGRFVVLARGILRAKGALRSGRVSLRYQRVAVLAGHSLLHVQATHSRDVLRALRAIGHPVVGDGKSDKATAKHFFMRHGLDRPFVHRVELTLERAQGALVVHAPLAGDLRAVLESLGGSALAQTV